ncbi:MULTISPECIES: ATP-binding cassette domain-containing protein [Bacillus]|uniref:ATP-binding cassette domain-containing protein n=1 Tax=Bacillus TaxID=1386 RepID=UPI000991EA24|nr:ATP-binding cassette domain-containing protein [Bacillus mycoides]OOR61739.1 ABC transporter ATP-binding protein [Bacillus mycoides]
MELYKFKIPKIQFENKIIINETELIIQDKNAYCLIGENGVGKTTLLNYLTMSESISIQKDKKNITNKQFKNHFAYIPSSPPLFELMTGEENIHYIASLWDINEKDRYYAKVKKLCKDLKIFDSLNQTINTYSLGMKYKLFFICMYSREIDLIILDEPFTALDSNSQEYVITLLKEFIQEKKSIIFTTHINELRKKLNTYTYELRNNSLTLYE